MLMLKNLCLIEKAKLKARKSDCHFKISAFGFSTKGNLLGSVTNTHRFEGKGRGLHAEIRLIRKYGKKLATILICRVGKSGTVLPIDACENCQKVADKLGIKIISVSL